MYSSPYSKYLIISPCPDQTNLVHIITALALGLNFKGFRKIAISDYFLSVCTSVRLPVHMEQLGSHWTEFCEI
jgi:hypothetical protein